jgi:hypothetical protein
MKGVAFALGIIVWWIWLVLLLLYSNRFWSA